MQDHLSREEVFGHCGRAALPESGGVCVGEDRLAGWPAARASCTAGPRCQLVADG
jgi:hypothetical protein